MAYISTEEVKAIRDDLKIKFPRKEGWKLSVTRKHGSSIVISFMEAPVNLDPKGKGNFDVNPYWYEEHYEDYPILLNTIKKTLECVSSVKVQIDRNAGDMGADYGDCNFFHDISIGKWSQDFKQI